MAELNLKKKDLSQLPDKAKVLDVLKEAWADYNGLVDAMLAINDTLRQINTKLSENPDIVQSVEFNATSIKDVEDKLLPALKKTMDDNITKVKTALDDNITRVKTAILVEVKGNSEKIVDLEGHSRRRNVIINGKEEVKGEVIEDVARQFMINELGMDSTEVGNFLLRDVHRLPKPKPVNGNQYPKPIIVAFVTQKDRNNVIRKAYNLKDTHFSMKSDLPKALNLIRSRMLKERFRLKELNPREKYRVSERGYKPVLQKAAGKINGTEYTRWEDISFA